jgi:two-component system, cell cycle response regulator DivK
MKKKILVVEDNAANLYLIRFILQKAGYHVIEAVNGEEGLKKAGLELPDLILMDMQLPVMNGYEATAKIKADKKTRNIPVFALTAYAMSGDEEKSLQAGCDAYLKKPVDPENIVQKIETLLEKFSKSGGRNEDSDC